MTNQPPVNKSFVRDDSQATIVCPDCDISKTIGVEQFRNRQHILKVRCKCGTSFSVHLEFRRHFRKSTDLKGTYDIAPPGIGGGNTFVTNLSLSGARFEVRGIHKIKVGQQGSLVFVLDNRKETELCKNVIIRSVEGNKIGCEFAEARAFEKELGFYLLP